MVFRLSIYKNLFIFQLVLWFHDSSKNMHANRMLAYHYYYDWKSNLKVIFFSMSRSIGAKSANSYESRRVVNFQSWADGLSSAPDLSDKVQLRSAFLWIHFFDYCLEYACYISGKSCSADNSMFKKKVVTHSEPKLIHVLFWTGSRTRPGVKCNMCSKKNTKSEHVLLPAELDRQAPIIM